MLHAGIDGLLHPLATPAHVIALAGLALVAGRRKGDAVEIAFALGLAVGLGALVQGARETPAGDMLLAGAMLCGLLTASGVTVLAVLAVLVAFLFGIALGFDSQPSAPAGSREAVAMLAGTACGGVVALALMTFVAFRMARLWQGALFRVAGAGIAAVALMALVARWGGEL